MLSVAPVPSGAKGADTVMDITPEIGVREARETDLDFIAARFEETIALWEEYEVTAASVAKQRANIEGWLAKEEMHLTVACLEGAPVGWNSLYITRDYSGRPLGKIIILYVVPEHRGRGIARRLKEEGEAWLRAAGARQVITEIDAKNERMLEINRRAGFTVKSHTLVRDL
jgi:GNAT superfamily N-acetyltransferase